MKTQPKTAWDSMKDELTRDDMSQEDRLKAISNALHMIMNEIEKTNDALKA